MNSLKVFSQTDNAFLFAAHEISKYQTNFDRTIVSGISTLNNATNITVTAPVDTTPLAWFTYCDPPAISSVTAGANPVCGLATTSLTANGITGTNAVVTWYTGANGSGSILGTGTTLTNRGAGTYHARVTADCGNAAESSIIVSAADIPTPFITPNGPTTFCKGQNVKLTASGSALSFNGSNQYLSNATGYAATNELTYELWLNSKEFASNDWKAIINYNGWAQQWVHFQFYENVLEFSIAGNDPYDQYFSFKFNSNTWYHVAVAYSKTSKNVKLYVNGNLSETKAYAATVDFLGNIPFSIGRWDGQRFFNGTMDELRIWNIARTQAEIQAYMNTPVPTSTPGLVAYYKMDEGFSSTTADSKGTATLTLVNSPAWVNSAPALANTYLWSTGQNTQSITTDTSGSYTVTTANTAGCSSTSAVTVVTVKTNAGIISATAAPAISCGGPTTTLTANGVTGTNAVVKWYTGANGNGSLLGTGTTLTNRSTGTYYARVTADCGNPAEASVTIISATVSTTINQTICAGQSYLGYNAPGTYTNTFTAANGCDSIRTLNLIVTPKISATINQTICAGQSYLGYNATGTYTNTFTAANGCDSIRTLNLTVTSKMSSTINQTICAGQSYLGYNATGTYTNTFTAANGCDSIRTLNLTVKPKISATINQTICAGQTYAGYNTTGTYIDTYTTVNGCDSIRTLNLIVTPKISSTINQTICEGRTYAGYNTTGTYIDTYTTVNGCDSIRTLNLVVTPKISSTINQTICEGRTYAGYNTTGTYTNTYTAANGCDSIRTLNLTIKPKSLSAINETICEGQSYSGYNLSGTYIDTFSAANGCDSIRTLNLTIKPKSLSAIIQTICEGQSYSGHTTSGTYIDTFTAANGCDSIRTLNLTVKSKSLSTINQTICEGQSYEGYNVTGTYTNTFTTANGCDSIRTLNLIVKPRSFSTISQTICAGQSYSGHTDSGAYIDTFATANGCDSIRTLNLSVKQKVSSTINQTICEGQTYSGYTTNGTYTNTFTAANGCDSIRTLNLIVTPKISSTINQTICEGQTYSGYATSGTYINTFIAANGCDSIRTLHLTVLQKPVPNLGLDKEICEADTAILYPGFFPSYLWQDGSINDRFIVTKAGLYSVEVNNTCGTAKDEIIITQRPCYIVIPNVFSPNNDGINDDWRIQDLNTYSNCTVEVFNRYGQKLFDSKGYKKPWDGTYNGRIVPVGTYYFIINIPELKKKFSGSIVTLR